MLRGAPFDSTVQDRYSHSWAAIALWILLPNDPLTSCAQVGHLQLKTATVYRSAVSRPNWISIVVPRARHADGSQETVTRGKKLRLAYPVWKAVSVMRADDIRG